MQSSKVKIINIICSMFCMLVLLFGIFCFIPKISSEISASAVVTEDSITNITDLVGTSEDEVGEVALEGNIISAPFNNRKSEFMPGKAFVPVFLGSNFEVNTNIFFNYNNEYLSQNKAIYVWVFIPDDMAICPYDLKLTLLLDGGSSIVWEFLNSSLDVMCEQHSGNTVDYGWKLFELKPSDAKSATSDLDLVLENQTLRGLGIEFVKNIGDFSAGNSEMLSALDVASSLAIYHIFMADATSDASGIVSSLSYSAAKFKQSFIDKLNNLYLNDKFSILGSSEVFEYAYVGKEDISNKVLAGTWDIDISINSSTTSYDFGDEIKLNSEGICNLTFTYKQMAHNTSVSVLSTSTSFGVERFGLGKFELNNQTIKDNQSKVVKFYLSFGFNIAGDIKVTSSDNSVLDATYYINDNVVYVTLKGKSAGSATVTIEASGTRNQSGSQNGTENTNYTLSNSMSVTVTSTTGDRFTQIFLWSLLAIFIVTLLIFMLISVVKARKNSVK